ncbi:MAG TPA: hypothetical protein VN428_02110, partial [Bryobacteraceae bacterium]|nr:hypothetical protein [Bryobacteraceae bacterium]
QQMLLRTLAQLDATQAALAVKKCELERVRHWLQQMLRHRYGQKRERVDENQLFLFAAEIASKGEEPPPEPRLRTSLWHCLIFSRTLARHSAW